MSRLNEVRLFYSNIIWIYIILVTILFLLHHIQHNHQLVLLQIQQVVHHFFHHWHHQNNAVHSSIVVSTDSPTSEPSDQGMSVNTSTTQGGIITLTGYPTLVEKNHSKY